MREIIRKIVLPILSAGNITVSKLTDKNSIISFIKSLQPFSTDKELVRLGPNEDGGYLIPNDLEGIEACFSPGVGNKFGFEQDCFNLGMKVFLADKSVDFDISPDYQFHFIKRFIGPLTNKDFITMDEWVNSSIQNTQSDLLLQMDIEGHEYLSIINMSAYLLNRFRIIVIEFHNLHKLWDKEFFNIASFAFEKLLQYHTCVHIHPNNISGIEKLNGIEIPRNAEFTFLRNDKISNKTPQTHFPHELDFDNIRKSHISLPECWYRTTNEV